MVAETSSGGKGSDDSHGPSRRRHCRHAPSLQRRLFEARDWRSGEM